MAAKIRVRMHRGESECIHASVEGTGPIDSWSFRFRVKAEKGAAVTLIQKTSPTAIQVPDPEVRVAEVTLDPADTAALDPGTYVCDLWRTDPGSEACLSDGTLTIDQEV